jgi:hypothetical protein
MFGSEQLTLVRRVRLPLVRPAQRLMHSPPPSSVAEVRTSGSADGAIHEQDMGDPWPEDTSRATGSGEEPPPAARGIFNYLIS